MPVPVEYLCLDQGCQWLYHACASACCHWTVHFRFGCRLWWSGLFGLRQSSKGRFYEDAYEEADG